MVTLKQTGLKGQRVVAEILHEKFGWVTSWPAFLALSSSFFHRIYHLGRHFLYHHTVKEQSASPATRSAWRLHLLC